MSKMSSFMQDYLKETGDIIRAIERLGIQPVLVGGMALVILGSRRVTRDFDFVIAQPEHAFREIIDVFYDKGLELASRLDKQGNVLSTIGNRRVAASRIRIDSPTSVYFFNRQTGLRIDLLFDFPLPAKDLIDTAKKIKIDGQIFHMASESNLMRLKKIAKASRSKPGDADDIAFLEARLKD